ncbi:MAG TPA: hypothetical protein VGO34_11375 [Alphaproteobacteria bacterium]|jgi:hypothetical protein
MAINRYQAFAEWRINTHRSTNRGRSVRYFRLTRDHTIIWTIVMRGHYAKAPPSVRECIAAVRCSKETARRIITLAVSRGFLQILPAPDDARRKQIVPSRQCVVDFENMVEGYLSLNETLGLTRKRKPKAAK